MSNTPRVVCVYHHRGPFAPLERLIKWFAKSKVTLYLVVRLDENDPYLQEVNESVHAMADELDEEFSFNLAIGPAGRDATEVAGELWGSDPEAAKELAFVTDSPTNLACFVLAYTGLK